MSTIPTVPLNNGIATLDTKTSSFFDHRDPAVVKRLGEAKRPV